MSKVLKLKFNLDPKGSFTLTINQPKENLKTEEVEAMMNLIVTKEVFKPPMGTIKAIDSAELVEIATTTLI